MDDNNFPESSEVNYIFILCSLFMYLSFGMIYAHQFDVSYNFMRKRVKKAQNTVLVTKRGQKWMIIFFSESSDVIYILILCSIFTQLSSGMIYAYQCNFPYYFMQKPVKKHKIPFLVTKRGQIQNPRSDSNSRPKHCGYLYLLISFENECNRNILGGGI